MYMYIYIYIYILMYMYIYIYIYMYTAGSRAPGPVDLVLRHAPRSCALRAANALEGGWAY